MGCMIKITQYSAWSKIIAVGALIVSYVLIFAAVFAGDAKTGVRGNPGLALNFESAGMLFLIISSIFLGLAYARNGTGRVTATGLRFVTIGVGSFLCFWLGALLVESFAGNFVG